MPWVLRKLQQKWKLEILLYLNCPSYNHRILEERRKIDYGQKQLENSMPPVDAVSAAIATSSSDAYPADYAVSAVKTSSYVTLPDADLAVSAVAASPALFLY